MPQRCKDVLFVFECTPMMEIVIKRSQAWLVSVLSGNFDFLIPNSVIFVSNLPISFVQSCSQDDFFVKTQRASFSFREHEGMLAFIRQARTSLCLFKHSLSTYFFLRNSLLNNQARYHV